MKIIVVSQAPGKAKSHTLAGASGRRLAALAGMSLADFLDQVEWINLLKKWPDGGPHKSGALDLLAAREAADKLRENWRGRKAVLLGRGVMAAFRLVPEDANWFQPIEIHPGVEVVTMPHPSGIGKWWNDPANVERARQFMQRLSLGVFCIKRRSPKVATGRPEKFQPEQIAAAIKAADGIMLHAAQILAEETGIECDRQTIADYCGRYPVLEELRERCRQDIGDIAEQNIVRSVRAGDADLSMKLLRCKMFSGRGYEMMIEGRVQHAGSIEHRHAHLHARLSHAGLDPTRYSDEQLRAIEDFAGMLGASAEGIQRPGTVGSDTARVESAGEG